MGAVSVDGVLVPVLTALIGALAAGAWAHRLALARERRAEVTRVVDRAIEAYAGADRALAFLASRVGTRRPPEEVQAAAELVTDREVAIRAAGFSLSLRLHRGHPLEYAFGLAHGAFTQTYLALGPAIQDLAQGQWSEQAETAVRDAQDAHQEFRDSVGIAIGTARSVVGQLGRRPRRREFELGDSEYLDAEAEPFELRLPVEESA